MFLSVLESELKQDGDSEEWARVLAKFFVKIISSKVIPASGIHNGYQFWIHPCNRRSLSINMVRNFRLNLIFAMTQYYKMYFFSMTVLDHIRG